MRGWLKRLEKLERLEELASDNTERMRSRAMERYLHAHENARLEIEGLEPLPELPYTEEDREDDRRFIEETIPVYRASLGWQTKGAQAVLDYWQRQTEERLKGA